MTTSSAEPARLQRYPDDLATPDSKLSTLASDLNAAMDSFAAGAGEFLPAGFDADWAGTFVQNLHDESVYLGGWVRSVGNGFALVGTDADGDGIFSAEDGSLAPLVLEPTRAEAQQEADGRAAAARIRAALIAAGYDPGHFDPATLRILASNDPQFRALYNELVGVGQHMWDEDYAAGFYDSLGVEGTHLMLGVFDLYAVRRADHGLFEDMDWIGDPHAQLLGPFVDGWARATGSPDLVDEQAAMLRTEDPVDQRHLALLMSGNPRDYDPTWLADGAERILVTGKDLNRAQYPADYYGEPDEYPGFSHAEAAGIAGHEIGLWAGAETSQLYADHPHPTPGQLQDTYDPIAQVVGAAYNGFNDTEAAAAAANSHFAYGISHGVSAIADLTPGS